MADILDHIRLTEAAAVAWHLKAIRYILDNKVQGLIPNEKAEKLPDGRLRIYVEDPFGNCELIVPAEDWCFEQ